MSTPHAFSPPTDGTVDGAVPTAAGRTDDRHATLHLTAQATVEFTAEQLWPTGGEYSRFGMDLPSFAVEVTRRLQSEGFVGYCHADGMITVIPLSSIKRIDFGQTV